MSRLYIGKAFTLRPFDLITSLTYVFMDNFCSCYHSALILKEKWFRPVKRRQFFCQINVPNSEACRAVGHLGHMSLMNQIRGGEYAPDEIWNSMFIVYAPDDKTKLK